MLNLLKSTFFCQASSCHVNLHLELVPSKNPVFFEKQVPHDKLSNNGYITTKCSDPEYSGDRLYVAVDFNSGIIKSEQDFLYIHGNEMSVKNHIQDLDSASMFTIDVNKYDRSSGFCSINASGLHCAQAYKMYYFRRNLETGKLETLHETKSFKIALKNKIYNIFPESVTNFEEQEVALFYEDDPFFGQIRAKKGSSQDLTLYSASTKRASSSKNSGSEYPNSYRVRNNSIFTVTSSPEDDLNPHPSLKSISVNKNLFQENYIKQEKQSKNHSIATSYHDGIKCMFSGHENPKVIQRERIDYVNNQDFESNESVIINEGKENDEYISKMCNALNENAQRSPIFNFHDKYSIPSPFINKDRLDSKSVSIENRPRGEIQGYSRRLINFHQSFLEPRTGTDSYNKIDFIQRRQARDFSSELFELTEKHQFANQIIEQNMRNCLKPIQELNDYNQYSAEKNQYFRQRIQSISNEGSVIILETTLEDEQEDENKIFLTTISSKKGKLDLDQFELDDDDDSQSNIVFTTESDQREMPQQYIEVEPQPQPQPQAYHTYTPKYSDRLYTVEEVCSASKESSNGRFKMLNSESGANKNFLHSSRYNSQRCGVREQNGGYEGKNLDFENMSAPVTQNSVKEMPLEVMILKQKVENFGMRFEYSQKECSVSIYDRTKKDQKYFFKWYDETSDKDLYEYFEGIVESIRCVASQ